MLPSQISQRVVAVALLSIAFGSACSRSLAPFVANQRPVVELRSSPTRSEGSQTVSYRIQWTGSDVDGSVSHYEYAIDPPNSAQAAAGRETTWVRTDLREYSLEFGRARDAGDKRASCERHTFVVRAIDMSADPATRASAPQVWVLDEMGVAPTVQITSPAPSALLSPTLPSPVDILWLGDDPDGQSTARPVSYRTRLFGPADGQALQTWMSEPDSLRRYYEPLDYAGWDSLGADADRVALDSLQAGERYLFVVVAFDETGTPTANFSLNSNMLSFYAAPLPALPPDLHVGWGFEGFEIAPISTQLLEGGQLEIPSDRVVDLRWFAIPPSGARIKGYQWVIDPEDVGDFTARADELTDVHRWSRANLAVTTARVGPFGPGERHRLYIQVFDNGGRGALYTVEIGVIDASMDRDLLIVDDTRLRGDTFSAGSGGQCLQPYPTFVPWPAAAELDTFLYAVGGVPWRGVVGNCPSPTGPSVLSTPGIFAGYSFDTLGTRRGFQDPTDGVPLHVLARYRHVIWLVDLQGALSSNILDAARPMTALRYMSQAGRASTLDAFMRLGGEVWLVGAGGVMANLASFNRAQNDPGALGMLFSSSSTPPELTTGRMVFDRFAWRSEIVVNRSTARIARDARAPWTDDLAVELRRRTIATDPLPPTRTTSSSFHINSIDVAYLSMANVVTEDVDADPNVVNMQSVLDTLYSLDGTTGGLYPNGAAFPRPIMTRYRGSTGPPALISGFAIWDIARPDAQALTDFVLGDLWQLPRQGRFARRAVALSERRPR